MSLRLVTVLFTRSTVLLSIDAINVGMCLSGISYIYPVPVLRTCADDCEHFYMDKFGRGNCSKHYICSPDTMYEFSPKGMEEE